MRILVKWKNMNKNLLIKLHLIKKLMMNLSKITIY